VKDYILEVRKLIPENYCKKIISYFDEKLEDATTIGGSNKKIRNCTFKSVMTPNSFGQKICSNYIQNKIIECVQEYKKKHKMCYIDKISSCDLLRYDHNQYDVGYDYHVDFSSKTSDRHLSISICLNNSFTGGEFIFDFLDGQVQYPQNTGDAIIFPSNFMFPHQVKKITSGSRYALIGWVI